MQVTEVIVSAGRTFNHPYEQYANLKPHITLKAVLSPDDDPQKAIRELQAKAEGMVEDHKTMMLQQIKDRYNMTRQQQEVASLEREIQSAQERLDRLRESAAKGLPAPEPEPEEVEAEIDGGDYDRRERQW